MRVLFTFLQVGGALAASVGLYLLVGVAWSLLIDGLVALVGATVLELMLARIRSGEGRS